MAALVIQNGEIVANETVGTTKIGGRISARTDSKWHLAACTRPMTVALLAMLVEEGKLSWDTLVSDILPEVRSFMHPDYKHLTLRLLLANRSGLPRNNPRSITWQQLYELNAPMMERRRNVAFEALKEKPDFPSGEKYRQSSIDFVLAAVIAEKITGIPFEEELELRIIRPLGMGSARFGPQNYTGGEAEPLPHTRHGNFLQSLDSGRDADVPELFSPAGTLHMSLTDWAKFVAFQLGLTTAPKLVTDSTLQTIQTADWAYSWGNHFAKRNWANKTVLYSEGSNGANSAMSWVAPAIDFAVLIASNSETAYDAIREAYKQIMAIYMPHVTVFQED
jgi:CubicO group peptidase (beta-lactamase class C family)